MLIEGESGVGKELIARAIHGQGERRAKPFVAVNCGAIPDNLVESILFGHEKGAFTGATEKHTGKFVEASGGTLFLDEVGELPLAAQVKLLRAIQEGEVEPVGGRKPVKVDVRIISATNRNLIDDVKTGRFREDLFYRLHVFPIAVPPLRERSEDIPDLVRHFLARIAAEEGKRVRAISGEALALLGRHRWPGNVRQLENAVFRAVVLAEGDSIGVDEFPQIAAQIADQADGRQPRASPSRRAPAMFDVPPLLDFGPGVAPSNPSMHGALALLDAPWRRAAARGDRGRGDPLCHRALSRADVGGRAAVADRPLHALPQARKSRPRGRAPNRGAQGTRRGALTLRANHYRAKFRAALTVNSTVHGRGGV